MCVYGRIYFYEFILLLYNEKCDSFKKNWALHFVVKINSSKRKLSSNWFPCSSAKLSFLVVRKSLVAGIFVVFLVLYVFCIALVVGS